MLNGLEKNNRKNKNSNRLAPGFGSIMPGYIIAIVGMLGMASMSLAQGDTWTTKTPMPTARWGLSTCELDGKIYAFGGAQKDVNVYFPIIDVYDPLTDSWVSKNDMPAKKVFYSTSVVNGKIYIIGGADGEWGFSSRVEEYDPVLETWTKKKNMPTAKSGHAASVVDGIIYVIGGQRGEHLLNLRTVEAYDPATDTWTTKTDLPTGRSWLATSVVDGMIYAVGGTNAHFVALGTVEAYDPATDVWTSKARMPTPRVFPVAEAVQGKIYAIGGTRSGSLKSLNTVEVYNPETNTWTRKAAMPTIRTAISSNTMGGKIYIMGGTSHIVSLDSIFATVEEYTPPVVTSVADPSGETIHPTEFVLHQNYPNPFNPETRLGFELPQPGRVILKIFTVLGQEVRTLVDEFKPAGSYEVMWDGRDDNGQRQASGVYLYRIEGQGVVLTKEMLLIN